MEHHTNDPPDWLVLSKTIPPPAPRHCIRRSRLTELLEAGASGQVTVLAAPPGFGKTVLLSQWLAERGANGTPSAWLSLDKGDNDAGMLAGHLAFILRQIDLTNPGIEQILSNPKYEHADRLLVSCLSADSTDAQRQTIIVLDGADELESEVVQSLVVPLMRYVPKHIHLVIATRKKYDLASSKLELSGSLRTIAASELALTASETVQTLDVELDRQQRSLVLNKTWGWPVMTALLKTHAQKSTSLARAIQTFGGDSGQAYEYLAEQFNTILPAKALVTLREASLLDEMEPNAVEFVCERVDARHALAALASLNGLVRQDKSSGCQFLNPLLREYLSRELEVSDYARYRHVCRRAARLIARRGSITDAMRCALRIADATLAAEILEDAGGLMLWDRDGIAPLRVALGLLPQDVIKERPRISLIQATICLKDGRVTEAKHILSKAQGQLEESNDPLLRYEIAKVALSISFYQGTSPDPYLPLIKTVPQSSATDIPQAFYCTGVCLAGLQSGNFAEAREAARTGLRFELPFSSAYFHVHLGVTALSEGGLQDAMDHFQKGRALARQHFPDDKDMRLVIDSLMAEACYERNDLTSASRLLGNANRRLRNGEAWFEIYAAGYTTAANLAFERSGLSAAREEANGALAYIREQELRRLRRLVVANLCSLTMKAGDHALARKLVQENGLSLDEYLGERTDHPLVRERYEVGTALCRLLIYEKRYKPASEALEKMIRLETDIGHRRAITKLALLNAIVHFKKKQRGAAFHQLTGVLQHARREGLVRTVIDEAPLVIGLLQAYSKARQAPERDHARFLLDALNKKSLAAEHLSRREGEVLRLLSKALPDKLIARQLGISENTVRFHLKNLYKKLGVSSRLQAVAEAGNRRLLDEEPVDADS